MLSAIYDVFLGSVLFAVWFFTPHNDGYTLAMGMGLGVCWMDFWSSLRDHYRAKLEAARRAKGL